jgi:hypothetical protein
LFLCFQVFLYNLRFKSSFLVELAINFSAYALPTFFLLQFLLLFFLNFPQKLCLLFLIVFLRVGVDIATIFMIYLRCDILISLKEYSLMKL